MLYRNKHESGPPLSRVGHFKFDIPVDQQTFSQVLFYITALAIVQDFRDNEKKTNKITARCLVWILFLPNWSYPCVSPHILFYMHGPAFLLCF